VNTNQQNHLYYGTGNVCPCCQNSEETLEYVLTCPNECLRANGNRVDVLAGFKKLTTSAATMDTNAENFLL
jgi:hypothetical protein